MTGGAWVFLALFVVMALVLTLPFVSRRVEEELEIFLFLMGGVAVTVSGLWTGHLVQEALREPVPISLAVLAAGIAFRAFRPRLRELTTAWSRRIGPSPFVFLLIVLLGLASSLITAIIAALVLSEVISALRWERKHEVRVVVVACFAIGLGAVLTPIGEPLAAIAVAKLRGAPHHAGPGFLFWLLAAWVLPLLAGLGALGAFWVRGVVKNSDTLAEDHPETLRDVAFRAGKVYLFVMALILLGRGFTPMVDRYLIQVPAQALYWINLVSAVLDNATLTAAEIGPAMSTQTLRYLLLGLLLSGGMLIPGNIPNIICAGKLSITSRQWARIGMPLGLALMACVFLLLRV